MPGLEPFEHARCGHDAPCGGAPPLRIRHPGGQVLDRHRHDGAFAALVLAGSYVEAGDTGRHRVRAGDVIIHQAWESHIDRFHHLGADVLTLPLAEGCLVPVLGRVTDADTIVRLAERDRAGAAHLLMNQLVAVETSVEDWPDLLAGALLADPTLSIGCWAEARRLHPSSIARGFRQQFGITPAAFRFNARAHAALRDIRGSVEALVGIAAKHGFADQAHMTRATRMITGLPPSRLRRGRPDPTRGASHGDGRHRAG